MKILLLDNYDSFTYNLLQCLRELDAGSIDTHFNNAITLREAAAYDAFVLSPGPGLPADAGIMPALIRQYAASKRILGVCLGHQAIAEAFGGRLYHLPRVFHGIATPIQTTNEGDALFKDIPRGFLAGRYHSWAVSPQGFPADLAITATDAEGTIMALQHRRYPVFGVQFHPESILTPQGHTLLANFLHLAGLPSSPLLQAIPQQYI
jgi:anthranilate synthase component 2